MLLLIISVILANTAFLQMATPSKKFVEFVPGQLTHYVAKPGANETPVPRNSHPIVPFWLASPEKKGGLELSVDGTKKGSLIVPSRAPLIIGPHPAKEPTAMPLHWDRNPVPTVPSGPKSDFPGSMASRNHAYVKTNTTLSYRNIIIEILVSVSMSATRLSLILEYDLIFSEDQERYITPAIISQMVQLQQFNNDTGGIGLQSHAISWDNAYSSSASKITGRFGGKYFYDNTYDVVNRDIQAGKFPKYLEMDFNKILVITRSFTDITKLQAHRFTDDLVSLISK